METRGSQPTRNRALSSLATCRAAATPDGRARGRKRRAAVPIKLRFLVPAPPLRPTGVTRAGRSETSWRAPRARRKVRRRKPSRMHPGASFHNQIDVIARALDPATTSAHLVAAQLRPARHRRCGRSIRRTDARPSTSFTLRYRSDPELQAHGGSLPRRFRSHAPRSGAARSHRAHGEQSSAVRHGSRLSVPRPRERPHFLTHDRLSHAGPQTLHRCRNVGAEDAFVIARGSRPKARVVTVTIYGRRDPGAANAFPIALRRNGRRRRRCARRRAGRPGLYR